MRRRMPASVSGCWRRIFLTRCWQKRAWAFSAQRLYFPSPQELRRKYFLRSRDAASHRARVVPELRKLVEFRRLNFKDADFGLTEKADVIFCRNVIIYFDRATQEHILQKLARHLVPQGYFFVGHAEALHDMDLPLEPVAPAAYRKADAGN